MLGDKYVVIETKFDNTDLQKEYSLHKGDVLYVGRVEKQEEDDDKEILFHNGKDLDIDVGSPIEFMCLQYEDYC